MSLKISFNKCVSDNEDISVDNNANGQESITDVDEEVKEVK